MSVTQASLLGDTFGSKASGTIPVGGIIMWSGSIASIPTGWALCNGSNGTPNLIDRFIVGAGSGYNPGATGGAATVTLSVDQIPSHSHPGTAAAGGRHGHKIRMSDYDGSFGNTDVGGGRGGIITVRNGESNVAGRIGDPTGNKFEQLGGADGGDVDGNGQHTHSVSTEARGGGQAHENRPPYYALAFIMRLS
jgi:microcystin-dependent protein